MSWDAWVDNMINTGKVSAGAIVGHDGATWATRGLQVDQATAAKFIRGIKGRDFSAPVVLNSKKFMVLRMDEDESMPYAYCRLGPEGACIVITKSACLIGMYGDGQQAGECNTVVHDNSKHLAGAGF